MGMKLSMETNIASAIRTNVDNAKSFLEVQDGALKTAGDLVSQMRTLRDNYDTADSSSNTGLQEVYARQFRDLQVQLRDIQSEKLNGTSLFNTDSAEAITIYTSTQGVNGAKVSLGTIDYNAALSISNTINIGEATQAGTVIMAPNIAPTPNTGDAVSISDVSATQLDTAFDNISALRAQSGGKLSTLGFVSDYLDVKSVGLASANSRIMDADLAEESMNLTKYNMQYQAAAAALVQSNLNMEVVFFKDIISIPILIYILVCSVIVFPILIEFFNIVIFHFTKEV